MWKNILAAVIGIGLTGLLFAVRSMPLPCIGRTRANRRLFILSLSGAVVLAFLYSHRVLHSLQAWIFQTPDSIWIPLPDTLWLNVLLGLFYTLILFAVLEVKLLGKEKEPPKFSSRMQPFINWTGRHKKLLIILLAGILAWFIQMSLNAHFLAGEAGILYNPFLSVAGKTYAWSEVSNIQVYLTEKSYTSRGTVRYYIDPEYEIQMYSGLKFDLWEALSPLERGRTDTNQLLTLSRLAKSKGVFITVRNDDIYNLSKLRKNLPPQKVMIILNTMEILRQIAQGLETPALPGQSLTVNNVIYRISSAAEENSRGMYKSTKQNILIRLELTLSNHSSEPFSLLLFMGTRLADRFGRDYLPLMALTEPFPDILPGETYRGEIFFQVPRDNGPWILSIRPSLMKTDLVRLQTGLTP